MNFENKVILITGASSGIGKELALQLSEERCSLALLARRKNLLDELSDQLVTGLANVKAYYCDVAVVEDVREVLSEVKKDCGKVDVAILNAAVGCKSRIKEYNSEKGKIAFDTNVFGVTNCVEFLLPDFIERREGIIVGVSSLADSKGWKGSGFYSASKAALTLLLESLRIELKPYNVKVITVKPGFVRTPMTEKNKFPMPFLMNVDKAARIILRGIKKEKRVIQFPLPTVLGYKLVHLVPQFLFDYLSDKNLKE